MNPNPFARVYGRIFSARPAGGRAKSPRLGAISGLSPLAGIRAAGDPGWVNRFISDHVPMLWDALLPEFRRTVDYWLDGDRAQALTVDIIWKEGAEDEEVSPGRYSHALIKDGDLPRPPDPHDIISADGVEYTIVKINAYAYQCSTLVLQDRTEAF